MYSWNIDVQWLRRRRVAVHDHVVGEAARWNQPATFCRGLQVFLPLAGAHDHDGGGNADVRGALAERLLEREAELRQVFHELTRLRAAARGHDDEVFRRRSFTNLPMRGSAARPRCRARNSAVDASTVADSHGHERYAARSSILPAARLRHMNPHRRALIEIHICVVLWGFTAILGKLITLPALQLVWWRMLLVTRGARVLPARVARAARHPAAADR